MAMMEKTRICQLVSEDVKLTLTAFFEQETFFTLDTEDFNTMLTTFGLEKYSKFDAESEFQQQPGEDAVVAASSTVDGHSHHHDDKAARKMKFIMEELLHTERVYVQDLRTCLQTYLTEMTSGVEKKPAGIRNKEATIFGNMQDIFHFHSHVFLKELDGCRRPADVGRCFVARAAEFERLYVDYCKNKPASSKLVLEHGGAYFRHIQAKHGLSFASSLDSCLLKPVQRMSKYHLLLRDLVSCCAEGEGGEIRDALEVMRGVPEKANDAMLASLQPARASSTLHRASLMWRRLTSSMKRPRQSLQRRRG